jgi:hypothetical protein
MTLAINLSPVTTTPAINLSSVSTTPVIKMLDKYLSTFLLQWMFSKKIIYILQLIESKQNMEKLSVSKFFSFAAGVDDTRD